MGAVSRRLALWRTDLANGVCAVPEEVAERLGEQDDVAVTLEHRYRGVTRGRRTFTAAVQYDVEWQLVGIEWPPDLRPGVHVTVAWQRERHTFTVRTHTLDEPVRVDGERYFHAYDPRVVTREYAADASNRSRVLAAVRRHGRVFDDGSAVLAQARLADLSGFARGARNAFLLRNAVDQLIREGYLAQVEGSVDATGHPAYPPVAGQQEADMVFYAPLVEPAPYGDPDDDADDGGAERHEHWVNAFVRRLPPGAHPSEKQITLHEYTEAEPLPPGYTFVKRHHRGA